MHMPIDKGVLELNSPRKATIKLAIQISSSSSSWIINKLQVRYHIDGKGAKLGNIIISIFSSLDGIGIFALVIPSSSI